MHHKTPTATSDLLKNIAADILDKDADDTVSLGEFVDKFASRGFGLILLFCAIPNLLPVNIPGISTIFSIVIIFFTIQWMLGFQTPWLPGVIRRKTFSEKTFAEAMLKIVPKLQSLEHLIKPRAAFMFSRGGIVAAGLCILIQTGILALPLPMIPFSNAIPAFFIMLMALAILSTDGALLLAAMVSGTTAIYFLALGIFVALEHMWEWLQSVL